MDDYVGNNDDTCSCNEKRHVHALIDNLASTLCSIFKNLQQALP